MNAKELRPGNFVTIDNPRAWPEIKGVTLRVTEVASHADKDFPESTGSISAEDISNDWRESYSQFDQFVKGIELTPEWLKSLGFDLISVEDNPFDHPKMPYWVLEGVCLFFNEGEHNKGDYLVGTGDHRFAKYTVVTNRWISAVHTLQNVFHSWTGRELELKK